MLLECLCNLTANEFFDENGAGEDTEEAIIRGLESLARQCETLIVVTNDVGSDVCPYEDLSPKYVDMLGRINIRAAKLADTVLELVCGIPLVLKGELP